MDTLQSVFQEQFGHAGDTFTVRAPGRVNLIGEHVDYNGGFVLPMAVPLELRLLARPRTDRVVELYSTNFKERIRFSLNELGKRGAWIDYIQGVASQLAGASVPLHGFEGVITSDIPGASGLSSSAAVEVAAALAFTHMAKQPMSPVDIALLCQAAENKFVGVNCGIMDQMAVAACIADHALLIDCRSLHLEQVPFRLKDHSIIVTDSAAPRELAGSAYNERRAQCEEGLEILQRSLPEAMALRDVTSADLEKHGSELPPIVYKRVKHIVDEIERTIAACEDLKKNNLTAFGCYMNDSHESLSKLYEVSSPELDWLATWSYDQQGVRGSRMTGAGFGGCTVTLIENQFVDGFMERLPVEYKSAMGRDARCWVCTAAQGAEIVKG